MSGGWGTPSWMGGDLVPGEAFVSDKSPAMARLLLDAAKSLGMDVVEVRAVTNGFIVPEVVYDAAMAARAEDEGRSF